MASETDQVIEDVERTISGLFGRLQLAEKEKEFVLVAARRLKEVAWESLMSVPSEDRVRMRGVVMALAIAMIVGPWEATEKGVEAFRD